MINWYDGNTRNCKRSFTCLDQLLELILYVVFRQTIERNLSQTSILPKNNLP